MSRIRPTSGVAVSIDRREFFLGTLDAFEANAASGDLEALASDFAPSDRRRTEIFNAVVNDRRELINLLDEEQWPNVFD